MPDPVTGVKDRGHTVVTFGLPLLPEDDVLETCVRCVPYLLGVPEPIIHRSSLDLTPVTGCQGRVIA
jgi:hypothetical protein